MLALFSRSDSPYIALLALWVILAFFSAVLTFTLGFDWEGEGEGGQHQQQQAHHPYNPFSHQGKVAAQPAGAASSSSGHAQGGMMAKLYP
jgi:hypothetical protein